MGELSTSQVVTTETITCQNCENQYTGNFCNICGQKADTRRYEMKHIWEIVSYTVLNIFLSFERGFSFTFKELLINPGTMLREYLSGKRAKHLPVISYILLSGTISVILYSYFKDVMFEKMALPDSIDANKNRPFSTKEAMNYLNEHPVLTAFLMIPISAWISSKLYKKQPYNYAEHLVVNAYLQAQQTILVVVMYPLVLLNWSAFFYLTFIVSYGYSTWAYHQFFQIKPLWKSIGKAILAFFLGYLLFMLISGIAGVIIAFTYSYLKGRGIIF